MKYADVIVDIAQGSLDRIFQYRIPDGMGEELTEGTPVRKAAARKKISISGPPQTIYGAGITERRSPFCGGYYI